MVLMAACWIWSRALADTFNGSAGGSWADLSSAVNNPNNNPFWDNRSLDGPNKNVGFQFSPGGGGPKPDQFWSMGGAVDNNVSFINDGHHKNASLSVEISGYSSRNALYAFNMANPSQTVLIFGGSASPSSSAVVTIPYANYGFKLQGPGGDFYSVTSQGNDREFSSNFAFFKNSEMQDTWWIAIEDLPFPILKEGTGDYNDMILQFSAVSVSDSDPDPVPEPATLFLLGSGLLGLAGLARRRFYKR